MKILDLIKQINPRSRGFISLAGLALYLNLSVLSALAMPHQSDLSAYALSLLILTSGAVVGGAIGSLISPSESGEKETFKAVLGVASAVLAGIAWKSFEPELHSFFVHDLPQNDLVQVRFFSFAIAAFLGAFVIYAYRAYGRPPDIEKLRKSVEEIRTALVTIEANALPSAAAGQSVASGASSTGHVEAGQAQALRY